MKKLFCLLAAGLPLCFAAVPAAAADTLTAAQSDDVRPTALIIVICAVIFLMVLSLVIYLAVKNRK